MIFKDYAAYYDMLYKDKDYKGEVEYVHQLIQKYNPGAKTILNLGCGTGSHDFELEKLGYEVTGVDLSSEMIQIAEEKKAQYRSSVDFCVGDLRTFRITKKFDVIVSLFHVMSYQTTNDDLQTAFETVSIHLNKRGLFLFDCWYGPGVLTDLPAVRYRVLENEALRIQRIANPVMQFSDNCVDVNYNIIVYDKGAKLYYEVEESHKMRYFFFTEILFLSNRAKYNFPIINNRSENDWNTFFILTTNE